MHDSPDTSFLNSINSQLGSCSLDQVEAAVRFGDHDVLGQFKGLNLFSHFQPILSLAHRRPVGYEALLRANTMPEKNTVPPLQVFDLARNEEDKVFLDRLCRTLHLRSFLSLGDDTSWLFLNINPQVTVHGKRYGAFFAKLLERYRMPAHRIVVEILEASIQEESLLADAVNYYKELGCLIAIDDFGAGHSNFDRIWRLAPQIVKLDRVMISQAANNQKARRILPSLVSLIQESGSLSLIEGIETERDALIAADSGVDFVQGYYFGRPEKSLPVGDPGSCIILGLCDQYKRFAEIESKEYHRELQNYVDKLQQSAKLLEEGATAGRACLDLLDQPRTERCYVLNREGKQLGANLPAPHCRIANDPRFNPLIDAKEAVWSRRPYFRRAINNPGEVQVSRPYLSITGATMCVTLSIMINTSQGAQVLCSDLDWNGNDTKS